MADDRDNKNRNIEDGQVENLQSPDGDILEEDNDISLQRKRKKIFLIILILLFGAAAYFFLFHGSGDGKLENEKEKKTRIDTLIKDAKMPSQEIAPRVVLQDQPKEQFSLPSESLELPSLPSADIRAPQQIQAPLPPPNLPVTVAAGDKKSGALPPPSWTENNAAALPIQKKRAPQKTQGQMIAISGGVVNNGKDDGKIENKVVDLNVVPDTSSSHSIASRMPDLRATVAQGKIINAVLETAISSDLEGTLRGAVTTDVYSELGQNILIPKGSKLIGSYSFNGSFGVSRVGVSWTRIILPNGFDLNVNSLGVDKMGRSGIGGVVDDKFGNILTSTVLLAGVSIGTAVAISKIPGLDAQVTTSNDPSKPGVTTTTTTTSGQVASQAITDASESVKGLVRRYADTKPTIYVDQGTEIRVFVSQDLVFPWSTISGAPKTIR